jgi:cell division protein FtsL
MEDEEKSLLFTKDRALSIEQDMHALEKNIKSSWLEITWITSRINDNGKEMYLAFFVGM